MVVAARASYSKAQKCSAHGIDCIGLPLRTPLIAVVSKLDRKGAKSEQTRPNAALDIFLFLLRELHRAFQVHVGGPEFVSRNLLLHERRIRFVRVEALDHIV